MTKSQYRRALGFHYKEEADSAPRVGINAEGELADKVVALARRYGVPVVENPDLARAASEIPLDEQIPEALFRAVAVVLNTVEQEKGAPAKRRLPRSPQS